MKTQDADMTLHCLRQGTVFEDPMHFRQKEKIELKLIGCHFEIFLK